MGRCIGFCMHGCMDGIGWDIGVWCHLWHFQAKLEVYVRSDEFMRHDSFVARQDSSLPT